MNTRHPRRRSRRPSRSTGLAFAAGVALAIPSFGCGGGSPPPVTQVTGTFYNFDDMTFTSNKQEELYPPLDFKGKPGSPEYIGVSILGGSIYFSRPKNWQIRRAGSVNNRRFIEYVSPNQYIFAVYERHDKKGDPWRDVLARYEEDAKKEGAELIGQRVPVATWNAQGRAYVVKRKIKAQKEPFVNHSREVVVRGGHRVDLIEIVHQGESLKPVGDELLRVMETFTLN